MRQYPKTAYRLEQSAKKAIQILRKRKLDQGLPFMINSDRLVSNQCYLEYPDGSFKIVEADSRGLDFRIIMELSPSETRQLKKKTEFALMPVLFIITGSNGAGKSTIGYTYLPLEIQENYIPFDGDKLALAKRREYRKQIKSVKELRKFSDDWVEEHFRKEIKKALKDNEHFVYEGHFRDDERWTTPKKFKRKKYFLNLIFMGLSDPHQSELRVIERAKYGGHNVPLYEIEANFYGNLEKVNKNFKLFNEIHIIDTSESLNHIVLLHVREGKVLSYVSINNLPDWFIKFLPNLFKIIKKEEN